VSAQFALHGRRTAKGVTLASDDDIRRYLLTEAGVAAVPFNAFGAQGGDGWFRLSIGVVSVAQIRESIERLRRAIDATA
jgi:aspartate aminotransferase